MIPKYSPDSFGVPECWTLYSLRTEQNILKTDLYQPQGKKMGRQLLERVDNFKQ
jgi:hypothetical protein